MFSLLQILLLRFCMLRLLLPLLHDAAAILLDTGYAGRVPSLRSGKQELENAGHGN